MNIRKRTRSQEHSSTKRQKMTTLEYFNHLPMDFEDLGWEDALIKLELFKPVKYGKPEFVKTVSTLINFNIKVFNMKLSTPAEAMFAHHIFNCFAANMWIMKKYDRLRQTVVEKLDKFSKHTNIAARKLASDFAYLRDLSDPTPTPRYNLRSCK